ncbi:MAG TPA: tyrosine--tRNA ligase [Candidatus Pacearchaeota archaeon]|nr:tyrosine--tRNA ligase [Candidatus Pacearchaeota archaeon]HPZ74647.1 tyrosine--tRNA ligase [Candidatus Pacearchaeota archaeon]HQD89189.1 tyrosine--tRNA ligase [Candidatus Pacearchaeota archaeon]
MQINTDSQKINELLTRGVEQIIEKESLRKKLKSGRQLRIKFGIDPTAPDIHLGNAVILWKLRDFQDLGHKIILIIGDFTAQIGDPTGKLSTRKMLTQQEIEENMKNYKNQIGKILDVKKIKIVYNSDHLGKLTLADIYQIFHFFTANQILERDMFQEREKKGKPIWLHEFLYPIFQAYDSAAIKADVEIGGSDQLFNMTMGRQLQPHFGQDPQDVMTMKLLIGTDGEKKMSKSVGNYIGIQESPEEQYGKIMSIKDELILDYFELCTRISLKKIKELEKDLKAKNVNPRDLKSRLAKKIVEIYHGKTAAKKAEKEFNRVFKEKKVPSKMPVFIVPQESYPVLKLLVELNLAQSKSEAKRLIEEGGVKIIKPTIDNKQLTIKLRDWKEEIKIQDEMILKVGKRKFAKIKKSS